jgi:hypothetical protein
MRSDTSGTYELGAIGLKWVKMTHCLNSQTNRTPGLVVEWKNEDHFTVEVSHERLNRVSYEGL